MPGVSQFLRVYCKTDTRRSDVKHPQHIQYTMRIVTLRVPRWVYCHTEVSRVVFPRQLSQVEALTTTVSYFLQAETAQTLRGMRALIQDHMILMGPLYEEG